MTALIAGSSRAMSSQLPASGHHACRTCGSPIDEAVRSGRIKQGHVVMMSAFGSGLTWATSLVRW
ncbi:MAG: 3-oxoacyl-[acyl-carrier-protein] synthase III C-terminal domain-containing protein [Nitrospirota bacterium]